MLLTAEVVGTVSDSFVDPATGQERNYHQIAIKPISPLDAPLRISVDEETVKKVKAGDKISFIPDIRLYNFEGKKPSLSIKIHGDFKVLAK